MFRMLRQKQLNCCEDVVRAKHPTDDYLDDVSQAILVCSSGYPDQPSPNLGSSELSVHGSRLRASLSTVVAAQPCSASGGDCQSRRYLTTNQILAIANIPADADVCTLSLLERWALTGRPP